MPAAPKVLNIPNPAEGENPFVKFEIRSLDVTSIYPVIQAGYVNAVRGRPRIYKIHGIIAQLVTSALVANRVMYVGVYKHSELLNDNLIWGRWATGNIANDTNGYLNYTPAIEATGATLSQGVPSGLVAMHQPLLITGGDYVMVTVDTAQAGDVLNLTIEVEYLNHKLGLEI